MFIQGRRKLITISALAAVMASMGSAAIASAAGYEGGDDDDSSLKEVACGLIGCPNGSRVCGTTTGTIKAGVAPFVGEVSVSYTCYENVSF